MSSIARPLPSRSTQRSSTQRRHTADRARGPNLIVERWTNAKAALIGFFHGRGLNACEISRTLGDGTSDATIRAAIRQRYDLPASPDRSCVHVPLDPKRKQKLVAQAEKVGCTPEEFVRRVLLCLIDDDLYVATTDGRFDA